MSDDEEDDGESYLPFQGPYSLGPIIGEGAYASVYKGWNCLSNSPVAVKILKAQSQGTRAMLRFHKEIDILLTQLDHPNVMRVEDAGVHLTLGAWYVMPRARRDLSKALSELFDSPSIVEVFRQVCEGVAHAHAVNVLHRDIKPENILEMTPGHWVVGDFGLGLDRNDPRTRLTGSDHQMGTRVYAAPEQYRSAKHVDERADVHGLGWVLCALVSGSDPPDPQLLVGHELDQVFRRAIDPQVERRFGTVQELMKHVLLVAQKPVPIGAAKLSGFRKSDEDLSGFQKQRFIDHGERILSGELLWAPLLVRNLSPLADPVLRRWWAVEPEVFRRVMEAYALGLREEFGFEECDDFALFCRRVMGVTHDPKIARYVIEGLVHLACRHHRWAVRTAVCNILRQATSTAGVASASEALLSVSRGQLAWIVEDLQLSDLHTGLQQEIEVILTTPSVG